ncbi:MAG: tRNA (adenosine(37)-N6)-threonylcarbamoyltransferase complex ATPase subunit type 1 TsaE [Gammaproteobacteria bacterium]|nr:tRNA (adenosine(37)-N6)-threonylcarbamoyltransferase complex ATPase subunit type 1 TsaE [Gammaproteobacteria bacterium]NIR84420.1 tRNA (adenosine(37)-N6)-threonylcarbamoyltransferase complex ATPase subunit type 1 TsaE [Gammaproteobacteria bacterium]NIR90901.1 tRNA (adenosine(37)-N6)-threonylcarbamoyltransferase complex ATPase subunit type 1 TsaE [Gammaproteobacteria bacterium]NIU07087.1 tRNA (adenosine(37)-N6)-threonylcarbamoyltransferase complex ATPase subunit type 1 TsaE [Gammaproteobacteri
MYVPDAQTMEEVGARLAGTGETRGLIYLQGPLGAGKTTVVRGFVQGAGFKVRVKSPTYTLVEPYVGDDRRIYHFDLYRLADPEELEYIGVRDYFEEDAICLIEWPERGAGVLPAPDLAVHIALRESGRDVRFEARTPCGARFTRGLPESS